MKTLDQMTNEQLTYLKQKWSAESKELDRDIVRSSVRLTNRLSRQEMDQSEIDALKEDLAKAESLLEHLNSTNAPQEMIDNQQALLDKISMEVETESKGRNVLTPEEAYLQQASIDELKLQKQYREDKITEIESLLTA
ncbi:hypothetical protein [Marivirga arenosa]|uniref:Uncharacterized protein n=1 Tax=Marivirga arenosa TaxID=3059076 RepID=A0AA49GDZ4_9BACT|nr:hypothetical protein [Marivirga sp. BKB1-2]WKK80726.1 hypothetical protein QYS47_27150 [Marivirga sp. BKB1-2]